MGVDLHNYCWDVMHYSPSWTPSDFEQKSGRIDRRRPHALRRRLRIGQGRNAHAIRVHHFLWPFTYDERVFRRMNFRGHMSERLLSSKVVARPTTELQPHSMRCGLCRSPRRRLTATANRPVAATAQRKPSPRTRMCRLAETPKLSAFKKRMYSEAPDWQIPPLRISSLQRCWRKGFSNVSGAAPISPRLYSVSWDCHMM